MNNVHFGKRVTVYILFFNNFYRFSKMVDHKAEVFVSFLTSILPIVPIQSKKRAKIMNQYNRAPHLTQDNKPICAQQKTLATSDGSDKMSQQNAASHESMHPFQSRKTYSTSGIIYTFPPVTS